MQTGNGSQLRTSVTETVGRTHARTHTHSSDLLSPSQSDS